MTDITRRDTMQAMGALAFLGLFGSSSDDTNLDSAGILDNIGIAEVEGDERPTPVKSDIDWLILAEHFDFEVEGGEVTAKIDTDGLADDLDIEGLTNPLTDTLDADGQDIENVGTFTTEVTEITERDEQPTEDDLPVGFYQMNGQLIARTEE